MSSILDEHGNRVPGAIARTDAAGPRRRDGISPAGWSASRICATLASVSLGAVLPILMVIANKAAPATLGAAALFATVAVFLAGESGALKQRYRALCLGGEAKVIVSVAVLFIVSLLWSIDPRATWRGLIESAPELVFALALAAAWPLVAQRRDIVFLLIGLFGAAILIAFERTAGMPLHALVHARGEAWDLKRSAIPPALLLWPAIAYCVARHKPLLAAALFAATLAGTIFSHSGAPGFALLAAGVVFLAAHYAPKITLGVIGALFLALIVGGPWMGTLATHALPATVVDALSGEHASHRLQIWTVFEERVHDRPVLGHGFNTSYRVAEIARPDNLPPLADNAMIADIHPHSIFLQFWVELGVLGGIAAAAVLAFVMGRISAATRGIIPARLGLLVAVGGVGLVGLSAWQAWWLASIAAALLWFHFVASHWTANDA